MWINGEGYNLPFYKDDIIDWINATLLSKGYLPYKRYELMKLKIKQLRGWMISIVKGNYNYPKSRRIEINIELYTHHVLKDEDPYIVVYNDEIVYSGEHYADAEVLADEYNTEVIKRR